jgi:hypothetical protein
MPTFVSKHNDLRVVLEPMLPQTDPTGVTRYTKGKAIQFHRGTYEANAQEARRLGYENTEQLVHAIKHTFDGNPRLTFNREFYEHGNAPDAQNPPVDKLLGDIADASVRRQAKRLRDIVALEESTHKREVILTSAKAALGALGDTEVGKRRPGRPHDVKPEDEAEATIEA